MKKMKNFGNLNVEEINDKELLEVNGGILSPISTFYGFEMAEAVYTYSQGFIYGFYKSWTE